MLSGRQPENAEETAQIEREKLEEGHRDELVGKTIKEVRGGNLVFTDGAILIIDSTEGQVEFFLKDLGEYQHDVVESSRETAIMGRLWERHRQAHIAGANPLHADARLREDAMLVGYGVFRYAPEAEPWPEMESDISWMREQALISSAKARMERELDRRKAPAA